MVSPRRLAFALSLCFLLVAALLANDARATVNQPPPGNEPMPVPTGMNEYSIWVARGFPMDAGTLAGLFKYHSINGVAGGDIAIDPVRDAHTTPGAFSPQCGLGHDRASRRRLQERARLVQRDGDATTPPPANQIYPLVPANLQLAPPNGVDVHGRRLLPAGDASRRRSGSTPGPTSTSRRTSAWTCAVGRPHRPRDDRRRRHAVHADEVFAGAAQRQVAVGHALGRDAHLPVGRGPAVATTSRSRTCRPARRAGRAAAPG